MGRKFFQIDVFTNQVFGGNPLAVFTEPGEMEDAVHLQIAREMNLSETTFVYPSNNPEADFRVRIFTPGKEIPFAGHPTLGTAHILWESGTIASDRDSVIFEMDAGLIKVSRRENYLFMEQSLPDFGQKAVDVSLIAEALSISSSDIDIRFPIQIVSTGFPALYVPLTSLKAIQAIEINHSTLKEVLGTVDMIYVFTKQTMDPLSTVHSRAFAPFIGISEDPATGSAAGALGAYLVRYKVFGNLDSSAIIIEQGLEIKRPSIIQVNVGQSDGEINSIQVGGQAITVLEGNIRI